MDLEILRSRRQVCVGHLEEKPRDKVRVGALLVRALPHESRLAEHATSSEMKRMTIGRTGSIEARLDGIKTRAITLAFKPEKDVEAQEIVVWEYENRPTFELLSEAFRLEP